MIETILRKYNIYTIHEAAKILGILPRSVRLRCEEGRIECLKIGRDWLVVITTQ